VYDAVIDFDMETAVYTDASSERARSCMAYP
jgi:hypothetical protein